jgi:hypothetical protein
MRSVPNSIAWFSEEFGQKASNLARNLPQTHYTELWPVCQKKFVIRVDNQACVARIPTNRRSLI